MNYNKTDSNLYWRKESDVNTATSSNLMKRQVTHHVEIIFNRKARKRFVFVSWLKKQKLILVSGFSGMVGESVS